MLMQVVNLLLVMLVHKGFDCRNRGVDRFSAKKGRNGTS
jgi:hypothetical protein